MQWSQIKTIFILSFLILNIYLLIQFITKQAEADVGYLNENDSTIEQQLEDENITFIPLPQGQAKEPFMSVRQKVFTDDDLLKFEAHKNQKVVVANNNFIVSVFEEPVPIPSEESKDVIGGFVKNSFAFPDEYELWDWNKEMNVLIFFQEENDRPVYFNQNGVILVFLNDEDEMVFYTQTMLGDPDLRQDLKQLIMPMKALEALYTANELRSGDKITKVDIGFHTRVPTDKGVQVFAPAWKVTVNDERNYFVNAIEGWIFSSNELNFLEESIKLYLQRINSMVDHQDIRDKTVKFLNDKLDTIKRGGKE